ncbi:MAG: purine-binding chemotaxis protein CheW [Oscillospiraceae bacterium]|nr:purine-binding chemotaxis protein CheW [Oscillospiraceae bacterium]MBQ8979254.1 purine-binding chemotaxis protein CheW [Oscillospiraceae bacterium]
MTEKYLTFTVDSRLFAVSIVNVREIMNNAAGITPVPEFPSYARGIIQLRGDVIPIVDLRSLFGLSRNEQICVIVIECRETGELVGLACDSVSAVEDLEDADIHPAPSLIRGADYICGVTKTDKGIVLIMDPAKLVIEN